MANANVTYDAARFEIQDVELLIVFLEPDLHLTTTSDERLARHRALESSAAAAGFAGNVVAVWADRWGRTRFIAPPEQHAFFQVVSYAQLHAQANTTLSCARESAA